MAHPKDDAAERRRERSAPGVTLADTENFMPTKTKRNGKAGRGFAPRSVSCREIWNRCDVCGRFISYNALDCGNAVRKMVTPDSAYSAEEYETLCEQHRDS